MARAAHALVLATMLVSGSLSGASAWAEPPASAASTPAAAAPVRLSPMLGAARATQRRALDAWTAADQALATAQERADELAHRIAALKRLRDQSSTRFTQSAELERLLEASLGAERAVADGRRARDVRAADVRRETDAALRVLDQAIVTERPRLAAAEVPARVAAAQQLRALVEARQDVKQRATVLGRGVAEQRKAWAAYDVKIDPLDGPIDLREKADFVEDTRDKLVKKRAELERRVREAREERELARASQSFRTEVSMFDEQTRSGRVTRRPSGNEALSFADAAPQAAGTSARGTPAPPAPTEDLRAATHDGKASDPSAGPGPAGFQSAPTSPASVGAPVLRQIDASALLNLNLTALPADADPAELERMLGDLGALERYLAARAELLRARAVRLEDDESRERH
jgi:hypothetical protein